MNIMINKTTLSNQEISWITFVNKLGMHLTLCSYGASIYEWFYKEPLALSPENKENFLTSSCYYGKTVGRVCGRIKDAKYSINDTTYFLEKNENNNCLHSGKQGLSYKNFQYKILKGRNATRVVFTYYSKDGEGGFNGNIALSVSYVIKENNLEFETIFDVTSDQDTIINLTSHPYFMLDGGKNSIKNHYVYISSKEYLTIDSQKIVCKCQEVDDTYDFSKERKLFTNNTISIEYDHDYVLKNKKGPALIFTSPNRTNKLEVYTNAPVVHIYDQNEAEDIMLTNGKRNTPYTALAIECKKNPLDDMVIKANSTQTMWIKYVLINSN